MIRFRKGDIAYNIEVTECLVVTVSEIVIKNVYDSGFKYDYEVRKFTVYRDFEIPLSRKRLDELTNKWGLLINDPRNGSTTIGGTTEKQNWLKVVTKKDIKEAVKNKKAELRKIDLYEKKKEEKFICPITGGKMIALPTNRLVLDAGRKYTVQGSDIIWYAGGRLLYYRTVYKGETRVFDINWKTFKWIEKLQLGNRYIDKPKTKKDWNDYFEEKRKIEFELAEKDKKYEEDVKSGKIIPAVFPIQTRIYSKYEQSELIAVKPMNMPSGLLFYMEPLKQIVSPKYEESSIKNLK